MTSPPQKEEPGFLENFFPGYFALVMATGIVSLAMHFEGFSGYPVLLLWLNAVFYVVLWIITVLRIAFFRSVFIADLTHHARGVMFLTTVAATSVLGVQFAILTPALQVAAGLWILAVLLWILLIYTFFAAVTIVEPKPSIDVAINGSWLLVTVATESLAVLGTLVAQTLGLVQRNALYPVYRADRLSLDFPSSGTGEAYAPLLDQYGRTGNHHISRGASFTERQELGVSAQH
jgi:tellurite resistance protein TehA-like permease